MAMRLVIQSEPKKGVEIALPQGEILVGRGRLCQVRLADGSVSRQHCRLNFDGTRLALEDLDSANGTFVNGKRVMRAELKPGDTLRVGKVAFLVAAGEAAPPAEGGDTGFIAAAMAAMAGTRSLPAEPEPESSPIELEIKLAGDEAGPDEAIPIEPVEDEPGDEKKPPAGKA